MDGTIEELNSAVRPPGLTALEVTAIRLHQTGRLAKDVASPTRHLAVAPKAKFRRFSTFPAEIRQRIRYA